MHAVCDYVYGGIPKYKVGWGGSWEQSKQTCFYTLVRERTYVGILNALSEVDGEHVVAMIIWNATFAAKVSPHLLVLPVLIPHLYHPCVAPQQAHRRSKAAIYTFRRVVVAAVARTCL